VGIEINFNIYIKQMVKRKQTRKRKQMGGFYPSVLGGIGNAAYLFAPALRAGYTLLKHKKRKTRRSRK
jgi:hypothetical protein